MRISLAWHNTLQNKKRSFAAVAGITFSVLLVFMQLGFLQTAKINSTLVYNYFDFDVIVVSSKFESMESADSFDSARILQLKVISGVQDVATLDYGHSRWHDTEHNNRGSSCMVLGYDQNPAFIRDEDTREVLNKLNSRNAVLLDKFAHPDYGSIRIGREATVEGKTITVADHFAMGVGFQAEGTIMTSLDTFQSLFRNGSRNVTFGLVKIAPGLDPNVVKQSIARTLPKDVLVFTKTDLVNRERNYYVNVKPIGIMFRAGAFVAFCVGGVILYQVLASEISNRLRELATLKAVGFTVAYVYGVGIQQALLFATLSYGPAFGLSLVTFRLVYWASHIPMYMSWYLALVVLAMSVGMTSISGFLALQKVRRADPADLF